MLYYSEKALPSDVGNRLEYIIQFLHEHGGLWKRDIPTLMKLDEQDFNTLIKVFNARYIYANNKGVFAFDNYNKKPINIDNLNTIGIAMDLVRKNKSETRYYLLNGTKGVPFPFHLKVSWIDNSVEEQTKRSKNYYIADTTRSDCNYTISDWVEMLEGLSDDIFDDKDVFIIYVKPTSMMPYIASKYQILYATKEIEDNITEYDYYDADYDD